MDLTATDPRRDWAYLSEGGASLVLSYVGPSHPTYDGTVLRLRKSPRSSVPSAVHDVNLHEESDDPSITFQYSVTSKLVPSEYLPELQSVSVGSQWLKELEDVIDTLRPVERTAKDGIDTLRHKAVLATDLVGGRGWAVEIKPKWGFLPSPEHLSSSTRRVKTQHCRFCMHARLKRKDPDSTVTEYCPLDFFSGEEPRVRKALQSLWESWVGGRGKGNNLRLFTEGKLVEPTDTQALSNLANKVLGSNQRTVSLSDILPSFIDALLPLILDNPLVSILANLQRTLDSLDIEGISQLWSRYRPPGFPLGQGETEPTLIEWEEFVRTYRTGGGVTLRYHILAYLLSATFKDCSIILRLQSGNYVGTGRDTVSVIDLDPKSVNRLPTWEALDQEIVRNFSKVVEEPRVCIDAHKVAPENGSYAMRLS